MKFIPVGRYCNKSDNQWKLYQELKLLYYHCKTYERHAFEIIRVEGIITMFFGRACIIGARDIFEWIPRLGTYMFTITLSFLL